MCVSAQSGVGSSVQSDLAVEIAVWMFCSYVSEVLHLEILHDF